MANFRFQGEIPGSKSVFNRALIVQSYFSVLDLKNALQAKKQLRMLPQHLLV